VTEPGRRSRLRRASVRRASSRCETELRLAAAACHEPVKDSDLLGNATSY